MKAILAKLIESELKKVFFAQDFEAVKDNNNRREIELLIYESFYNLPDYLQDYKDSWGTSELKRLTKHDYAKTVHSIADALAIRIIKYEMGI